MPFTTDEKGHYLRQIAVPEIGLAGQEQLKRARVLCLGAGGLGSPVAMYLAAMGVGHLGLVDFDTVESSNLSRQLLHRYDRVGQKKVDSARETLTALSPWLQLSTVDAYLDENNIDELLRDYDVVVDGTDNLETRYVVNDGCLRQQKPLVSAALFQWEGHLSVFNWNGGPCYRCLFPSAGTAVSCAQAGVLGVVPGILGTLQAAEVIKVLLRIGRPLSGELLVVDVLESRFRKLAIEKRSDCLCANSPRQPAKDSASISAEQLRRALADGTALAIDVRSKEEYQAGHVPGARHLPLPELLQAAPALATAEKTLVLYCAMGPRAAEAQRQLAAVNIPTTILRGSYRAWLASPGAACHLNHP